MWAGGGSFYPSYRGSGVKQEGGSFNQAIGGQGGRHGGQWGTLNLAKGGQGCRQGYF